MFWKYLEISKHTKQSPWKKTLMELFLAMVQAFHLYVFVKINKYTGRFQDSIFLKKTLF